MKPLFLKWHLGAGDAIICNGLVRVLAQQYDEVILPAKHHNLATVAWMFSDLHKVTVVRVRDDTEMIDLGTVRYWKDRIGLGLWSDRGIQEKWSEGFYADADVPFECRWSEFKLPTSVWCHGGKIWDIFWHDDPHRGYSINLAAPKDSIYMPSSRKPFQDHLWPLETANEIHVIDSCFLCLADSIPTNAKRHVLHAYATAHDPYKKFGPPTLRKNWEILR